MRSRAGFTLIELMIVMAIVLVLLGAGLGISSDYLARRHLEREAGVLLENVRTTQMNAVFRRQPMSVEVDVATGAYRFQRNDGSGNFLAWVQLSGGVRLSGATGFVLNGTSRTLTYDAFGVPTPSPSGGGTLTLSLGTHATVISVSSVTGRVIATPIS